MKIHYKAQVSSTSKEVDGLPMTLTVGSVVNCKLKNVTPLCRNADDREKKWYKEQIERNTVDGK